MTEASPTHPDARDQQPPKLADHLAKLEGQLELLKARVRQAQQLAGLGTAAATFAHEVNNLLTPVLSYSQAALDADDPDLQRKALTTTIRNVQMLVAMSGRVLTIAAAKPPARTSVSVRTAADEARECLCRDLDKDGITFSLRVDESVKVWADPLQLQQVLFNLFLNARDAMAPSRSGRLTVSAQHNDDRVMIEVRNTGETIPSDLLPHIFEPFETSKPVQRDGQPRCGGLGLALCRDLVEENAGTITVTSNPDSGTRFEIILPANDVPIH